MLFQATKFELTHFPKLIKIETASRSVVVQLLSCFWLFVTPWTAACQAPLSSTIYWNLLPFILIASVMLSNHLILCHPPLLLPKIFSNIRVFSNGLLFTSGGQSIGASVLPMNIQGWFPLGLTGLISLLSMGLSRVFSSTTVQKYQFFSVLSSLWSNSHIYTWLLEKPWLWLQGPLLAKWCLCFFSTLSRFITAFLQGADIF